MLTSGRETDEVWFQILCKHSYEEQLLPWPGEIKRPIAARAALIREITSANRSENPNIQLRDRTSASTWDEDTHAVHCTSMFWGDVKFYCCSEDGNPINFHLSACISQNYKGNEK